MNWKVIEISDDPIADMQSIVELPTGKVGELIVQGQVVTDQYVTRTDANADHKINDGNSIWHRWGMSATWMSETDSGFADVSRTVC